MPKLRFRADGTFTVIQFTDTHCIDGGEADQRTLALMRAVLASEDADLAVFTGDVIDGRFAKNTEAAWRLATAPLVERRLPWATVFGNHDGENNLAIDEQMAIQRRIAGCLSQAGPKHLPGCGNYLLPIYETIGQRPAAMLSFLDSHAYADVAAVGGYDWPRPEQIRWLAGRLTALHKANPAAPALLFQHIPLPEYAEVWNKGGCRGEKNEEICYPRLNTGLFAALRLAGNVQAVFVGHDHINDFASNWHGIELCYGRATGYNTYGRDGFAHGARLIRLRQDPPGFATWLRLDDGSQSQYAECGHDLVPKAGKKIA